MPIVGGLDIHRKQITFDYLDTVTGEVRRGQIAPADRAHVRAWLARFAAAGRRRSRWRGAPGGGMSPRSWPRPGSPRTSASRPTPLRCAAASGTPRPTRPTPGTCGRCWPREGCPNAGFPPAQILEYRALLETYHDLRTQHTAWVQRIHAVFFHQGAPPLSEGALRTGQGLAGLRAAAAAHPPAAGTPKG